MKFFTCHLMFVSFFLFIINQVMINERDQTLFDQDMNN